jgi:hypothetical protein
MIKEDKVLVKINLRNVKYYREMGFNIDLKYIEDKVLLEVPINKVNKNSKIKITAICDVCHSEGTIMLSKYWLNFERGGYNFYSCFGCKNKKKEMTTLKEYGVKSFSQTEEFKKKFKESSMKRYGVNNPNKSEEVRNKIKETNIIRYGVDSYFKTEQSKEYNKKWMSSDTFRNKSKETLIEKYGVDSYSKTDKFKNILMMKKAIIVNKIKQSFLEKYGVDSYFKTDEFKNMQDFEKNDIIRKRTCLEKYGVDNVSKVLDIHDKILNTKIKNGYIIPEELLSEWDLYKKSVRKITNRFKKELYENWNGSDYYDNELIKGYLSYSHTHRFYPTIDHKISVYFGFMNSIPPEEIGNINNLCITKRYINSMKNSLIEEDFFIKIK